ncbi:hypothetical protein F5887DRAFT_1158539 [Amanita rubescens]|nr:hypothetical protein F5887DRAFT_1158539 [Amanita rubescens]
MSRWIWVISSSEPEEGGEATGPNPPVNITNDNNNRKQPIINDYSELNEYGPKKKSNSRFRGPAFGASLAPSAPTPLHGRDINLGPEYQRDVAWPEGKQIDSVFYLSPVRAATTSLTDLLMLGLLAVKTFDDGPETRTCIDGKQRLTSVYSFMANSCGTRIPARRRKKGKHKTILPGGYRRLFANNLTKTNEKLSSVSNWCRGTYKAKRAKEREATVKRQDDV